MTGQNLGGAGLVIASAAELAALTPTDGQLIAFQDATTLVDGTNTMAALGMRWLLQYNGKSASGSKWEWIGGSPLYAAVTTSETTTSASYTDLATVGPAITLPLAMDCFVAHGARLSPASNVEARMSYAIGATAAVDADSVVNGTTVASFAGRSVSRVKRQTGLAAALTLTAKYILSTSSSTNTFSDRWMTVQPIRVG